MPLNSFTVYARPVLEEYILLESAPNRGRWPVLELSNGRQSRRFGLGLLGDIKSKPSIRSLSLIEGVMVDIENKSPRVLRRNPDNADILVRIKATHLNFGYTSLFRRGGVYWPGGESLGKRYQCGSDNDPDKDQLFQLTGDEQIFCIDCNGGVAQISKRGRAVTIKEADLRAFGSYIVPYTLRKLSNPKRPHDHKYTSALWAVKSLEYLELGDLAARVRDAWNSMCATNAQGNDKYIR